MSEQHPHVGPPPSDPLSHDDPNAAGLPPDSLRPPNDPLSAIYEGPEEGAGEGIPGPYTPELEEEEIEE
jgi:hypothetical protein